MDFNTLIQSLQSSLGRQLPALLAAIAVGVAGWLIAIMVKAVARRMLGALKLDRRFNDALALGTKTAANASGESASEHAAVPATIPAAVGISATSMPVVDTIARGLYAVVLVLTAIAVLNALNLAGATAPLTGLATDVLAFMPNLLAALVLGAVAWLCAVLVRALVARALTLSLIDVRLAAASGSRARTPLSRQLSQSAFWLTLLLFVPTILGALQLNGLLAPVQTMMSGLFVMVPNILAGGLIGAAGYLLAKLLRVLTVNLLEASGANRMATKLGLGEAIKVSKLAGTVVYVLVLIPTLIAALDALKIDSISAPAIAMLTRVMEAVPAIIGAALILAIAYFAARIVASLATEFLAGAGIDRLPEKMGFSGAAQRLKVSVIVGKALMFFALLLAVAEAASRLGFARISDMSASLIRFGGNIILGTLVLVIGAWLANLAHRAIQQNAPQGASPVAGIVRIAILGFVLAMGLRAMGIAPEVVNITFALTFGAVAVAAALSFGLGGREAAGRHLEQWFSSWRQDSRIEPESLQTASKDTTELSPAAKAGLPRRGRGGRSGPTVPL